MDLFVLHQICYSLCSCVLMMQLVGLEKSREEYK